jgi:hypothetical protein
MAHTPRKKPLAIGMRVRHALDNRAAIVIGTPEVDGHHTLIPVNLESSTRSELWPDQYVKVRPKREQFPAHGGTYRQRPGYLLKTK